MPQQNLPLVTDRALAGHSHVAPAPVPVEIGVAIKGHAEDTAEGDRSPPDERPNYTRYGIARLLDERGELRPMGAIEEEIIRFAIRHYRGRMSEVARRVGIGRSTLYRKIKEYGIVPGEPVAS